MLGIEYSYSSKEMSHLISFQQVRLRNLFPSPGKENSLSFTRLGAAFLFSATWDGGGWGFFLNICRNNGVFSCVDGLQKWPMLRRINRFGDGSGGHLPPSPGGCDEHGRDVFGPSSDKGGPCPKSRRRLSRDDKGWGMLLPQKPFALTQHVLP